MLKEISIYMDYIGILHVLDTIYFYRTRTENGYRGAEKWSVAIHDTSYDDSRQCYLPNIISQNVQRERSFF